VKSWVHVPAVRVIPHQGVHKMATITPVTVSTVNLLFADSDILSDRRLLKYCFALYNEVTVTDQPSAHLTDEIPNTYVILHDSIFL